MKKSFLHLIQECFSPAMHPLFCSGESREEMYPDEDTEEESQWSINMQVKHKASSHRRKKGGKVMALITALLLALFSLLAPPKGDPGRGKERNDPTTSWEWEISRAEFLQTLLMAAGIYSPDRTYPATRFPDDKGRWYTNYIACAVEAGIANGYEDGTFRPEGKVKREEAAAMIFRTMRTIPYAETTGRIVDFAAVSQWARPYVASVAEAGIMVGFEDGKFHPMKNVTHAQMEIIEGRIEALVCPEGREEGLAGEILPEDWASMLLERIYGLIDDFPDNGTGLNGKLLMEKGRACAFAQALRPADKPTASALCAELLSVFFPIIPCVFLSFSRGRACARPFAGKKAAQTGE